MTHKKLLSKPIAYVMFGGMGFLFLFFCLTGRDLAAEGNILWTTAYTLKTLGISLAAGGALGALVCVGFRRAAQAAEKMQLSPMENSAADGEPDGKGVWKSLCRRASGRGSGRVFGVSFCLMFLAWLPGFFAYYPAICAYDTPIQMGQIIGNSFIDHHPIAHTLLIKGAIVLGENIFGSVNSGIAIYILFQMTFLAFALAVGMSWLWRWERRRIWLILAQLFCMLYPFQLYMSISVTKDMVFASFFVLQLLALYKVLETHRTKELVRFALGTIGMILFRNNGRYAFLVFLVVLFAVFLFGRQQRRFWGRLLLWALGAFLAGNLMLSMIYKATNAQQGDKREMLSAPIQQLARTMIYHGGVGMLPEDDNAMGEADKALINDFLLYESYRKYRPEFADPVKSNTNTYVVRYRAKEFLTTYFRLLTQYPGDFLNAVLAVDAGYLYPGDVSHAYVNAQEGQAAGGGYVQTRWDDNTMNSYGVYKDSKWQWLHDIMEGWANDNAYLKIPVLKYLFVPGVWVWLYLLLLGWWVLQRKFRLCIPLSLIFGYYLTLLLGPTVQLRYIYPIMLAFPFLLFVSANYTLMAGQKVDDVMDEVWEYGR